MGNVRLYGATSGYTELAPPAVAPDGVLTLPSGTGTIATTTDQGLVHINTTTVTSVTSASFNDVFTSVYANYRVLAYFTASSQSAISIRYRASGSDDSGTNYQHQEMTAASTSISGSRGTSQTSGALGATSTNAGSTIALEILSPQLSLRTGWQSHNFPPIDGAQIRMGYGQTTVTTAYDGFSFISTTNFSGTIRVYGYKNS